MQQKISEIHSFLDFLRSLSYWQVFTLSSTVMLMVGLIIGAIAVGPLFFQRMAQEVMDQQPQSPVADMAGVILPILPYVIPAMVICIGLGWLFTRRKGGADL